MKNGVGIAGNRRFAGIAILFLLGVVLWCYYLSYYRPRTLADLLPASVEEAEWCRVAKTDENFEWSGYVILLPEEREALVDLLEAGKCRRYGEKNGLPIPNYMLEIHWSDGENGYVSVLFSADWVLINTNFDGKSVPMYQILSGGEELTSFAELMLKEDKDR